MDVCRVLRCTFRVLQTACRPEFGISLHLKPFPPCPPCPPQGYALMCVSLPLTDCVLETVPEDDAYMLQVRARRLCW